ncbi:MAG TPA: phosphate/phosphite/phosphonate ABC transporter substrate-binding protein [Nostocaceae cyanobacterium]|nr:phosphate/phosphite/phosphonate ABC transporter substrate-binding protein [Nostocaceae cyanobacterium]
MAYYQLKVSISPSKQLAVMLMLISTMLLLNTGCSNQQNKAVPHLDSSAPNQKSTLDNQSETLRIAVIPAQGSQKQAEQLKALAEYLEKSIGHKFDIQVQKDYDTAVNLLVTEKVQIAYLGPLTYIQAKQQNPHIEPIVAPITKATGRPWHTSMIIANSARIKTVKDLPKQRFGFVSKSSTTGYLIPIVELFDKQGINPDKDFSEVKFIGSHDKTLAALIAGEVDAVAVEQEAYVKAQQENKLDQSKYVKIWESTPLATAPIVVSSKLNPQLINALKKALIDAPEGIVAVSGVETAGYTLVDDTNYQPIRQLQAKLDAKTKK